MKVKIYIMFLNLIILNSIIYDYVYARINTTTSKPLSQNNKPLSKPITNNLELQKYNKYKAILKEAGYSTYESAVGISIYKTDLSLEDDYGNYAVDITYLIFAKKYLIHKIIISLKNYPTNCPENILAYTPVLVYALKTSMTLDAKRFYSKENFNIMGTFEDRWSESDNKMLTFTTEETQKYIVYPGKTRTATLEYSYKYCKYSIKEPNEEEFRNLFKNILSGKYNSADIAITEKIALLDVNQRYYITEFKKLYENK